MRWKTFNRIWMATVVVIGGWWMFIADHPQGEAYDLEWLKEVKPHEQVGYDLLNQRGDELKQERTTDSEMTLMDYDRLAYEYVNSIDEHFNEYYPYLEIQYANPHTPVHSQELNMFSAQLHDEAVYFFSVVNKKVPKERINQHEQLLESAKMSREAVSTISASTIYGSLSDMESGIMMYGDSNNLRHTALDVK